MMRRNVLYVCIRIPTHCKHIIPAGRKQESTWSNNNKITPEYVYREYMYPVASVIAVSAFFWTFVDRRMSERRDKLSRGSSLPPSDFFFSFSASSVVRSQSNPRPSLPFLRPFERVLSGFIGAMTWPKELPVFAPIVYCCCVVIRGDLIEETSSSHKAPLENSFSAFSSLSCSCCSSHKHADVRKVFQSAFLERCTICL